MVDQSQNPIFSVIQTLKCDAAHYKLSIFRLQLQDSTSFRGLISLRLPLLGGILHFENFNCANSLPPRQNYL